MIIWALFLGFVVNPLRIHCDGKITHCVKKTGEDTWLYYTKENHTGKLPYTNMMQPVIEVGKDFAIGESDFSFDFLGSQTGSALPKNKAAEMGPSVIPRA